MYSRCSHCERQQKVTTQQLRRFRGLLICKHCRQRYDALETLSDRADAVIVAPAKLTPEDRVSNHSSSSAAWSLGCALMLALAVGQWCYFESEALKSARWLRAACRLIDCSQQDTVDVDDWSVSHARLEPYLHRQLAFSAALTHQGMSARAFPKLKLILLGLQGDIIAERVFQAAEYTEVRSLAVDETRQIQLWLAEPASDFAGFQVSLL